MENQSHIEAGQLAQQYADNCRQLAHLQNACRKLRTNGGPHDLTAALRLLLSVKQLENRVLLYCESLAPGTAAVEGGIVYKKG